MPARLIVNADDFGLTEGVNRAVAQVHQAGALTSATLMATGQAFSDAVAVARANPSMGVGCHLVFVDGTAICDPDLVPSLVQAGKRAFRRTFTTFVRDALLGSVLEDDLVREGVAQVMRLQAAKVNVTHLDTHKHLHMLPIVARAALRVADQCCVGAIRTPFEPDWSRAMRHGSALRRAAMTALDANLRRGFGALVKASAIRTTDGTAGIAATGSLSRDHLEAILEAVPQRGTWEFVVHPGYNDEQLAIAGTQLRHSREIERRILAEYLPEAARKYDIELIHYGQL